ncbi:MAG: hypothetical protein AB1480_18115 [Nitrospirota bacterium]
MKIFTICKKGKGDFIKIFLWYVKTIFITIECSKSFSQTPERGNNSLKSYCLLEDYIDQIRARLGMVSFDPGAGIKIKIVQKRLLLSHLDDIITEFLRWLYIGVKNLAGFSNRRFFYMEGSL